MLRFTETNSLPVLLCTCVLVGGCGRDISPEEQALRDSIEALHPMDRLPDGPAGDVVRRAIEAHGGWEAWRALPGVEYRKVTITFEENGAVADSAVERHRYRLHPTAAMRIDGTDDRGRDVALRNVGDQAWKYVDGRRARGPLNRNEAWNSTFGSQYVFAQPFKLTDVGTNLTHLGPEALEDGTEVTALQVDYDPGAGSSGGMHTWVYYFDRETGLLAGYRFGEGDTVSTDALTRHGDYREVDGVRLFGSRTAYRVTADGSLRTTRVYRHLDPVVRSFPDSIFQPPESGG